MTAMILGTTAVTNGCNDWNDDLAVTIPAVISGTTAFTFLLMTVSDGCLLVKKQERGKNL